MTTSKLNELRLERVKKKKKILGRGTGSGIGKSCTRGQKGAGARSGSGRRPTFTGGQTGVSRLFPKRGQNRDWKKKISFKVVNVSFFETDERVVSGQLVDLSKKKTKVLGEGSLTKKISIKAAAFSKEAKQKIEASGGTWEVSQS